MRWPAATTHSGVVEYALACYHYAQWCCGICAGLLPQRTVVLWNMRWPATTTYSGVVEYAIACYDTAQWCCGICAGLLSHRTVVLRNMRCPATTPHSGVLEYALAWYQWDLRRFETPSSKRAVLNMCTVVTQHNACSQHVYCSHSTQCRLRKGSGAGFTKICTSSYFLVILFHHDGCAAASKFISTIYFVNEFDVGS